MGPIEFRPSENELGERVDVVVARRSSTARAAVQRALRSGELKVSGEIVRPSHRLGGGDVVAGRVPAETPQVPTAESIPVKVRYDDARMMVISKPAGLVAHPSSGHPGGTLVNALLAMGVPLAARQSRRPGIVHRLDKDTSGLLLVAKDDETLEYLQEVLRQRRVERRYLALVRGRVAAATGTVDAPVGRHPARPRLRAVVEGGKPAITHYRRLEADDRLSLLDLRLASGRTHQIRVHLAHIGHPVLGDRAYGGAAQVAAELGLGRPFLHAYSLTWPDPGGSGDIRNVVDELPDDLVRALRLAGLQPPPLVPAPL